MEESENNSNRASQGEVDITGRVLQVDIRAGTFEIWPDCEEKITASFTGEQGSKVLSLDFPDRTEFPGHEALWDGANYKTAY